MKSLIPCGFAAATVIATLANGCRRTSLEWRQAPLALRSGAVLTDGQAHPLVARFSLPLVSVVK